MCLHRGYSVDNMSDQYVLCGHMSAQYALCGQFCWFPHPHSPTAQQSRKGKLMIGHVCIGKDWKERYFYGSLNILMDVKLGIVMPTNRTMVTLFTIHFRMKSDSGAYMDCTCRLFHV